MYTNEADVSSLCTHVRYFDAHISFFIRTCMQCLVRIMSVFWLTYILAVLYSHHLSSFS